MIRVNYHLTEGQVAALRDHSRRTGLTVAELIRRAVDAWLAAGAGGTATVSPPNPGPRPPRGR